MKSSNYEEFNAALQRVGLQLDLKAVEKFKGLNQNSKFGYELIYF